MNNNSEYICTFKQKLSYDDLVNYFDYKISAKKSTKFFRYFNIVIFIIAILNLIYSLIYSSNKEIFTSVTALILFFMLLGLYKKELSILFFIIKLLEKRYKENEITLFEDFIFFVSLDNNKKSCKILIKDIAEIEETSHYFLIKIKSPKKLRLLISLNNRNKEIEIMLDYLHKVCHDKFNYNFNKQNYLINK